MNALRLGSNYWSVMESSESQLIAKQTCSFQKTLAGAFASALGICLGLIPCSTFATAQSIEQSDSPIQISGVYPHLNMRNDENECGTGAIVPWQGDLWAVTYAPHAPSGSSDKLYQITADLEQKIFSGSVGGTPANRMIHRESNQLLIGPYLIDQQKRIRTIPSTKMFGRLTGTTRHLFEPESMVYYATMEEGLYSVDVRTLDVECLIRDGNGNAPKIGVTSKLPGYHGKGLYTGQHRVVYSNNGEKGGDAKKDPTVASGALAQWSGQGDWNLVRRNQFTEVTGPGGIYGNEDADSDPVWAMGWDERSVILAMLQNQKWHYYRLPKGSHSYDGAHGWNTEWPRIREIGNADQNKLLATMHGTFWRFPKSFSLENSAGIAPRSNYLKVIGDFCRWNDRIVLGCDDSARAEFLNTRAFKAEHSAAKQSNSNLWFVESSTLDNLCPAIGRGSVWLREDVKANSASDPFLFSGFDHRQLHLTHHSPDPIEFTLEVDRNGLNDWQVLKELTVPASSSVSYLFPDEEIGTWIRLKPRTNAESVTANFQYRNHDRRPSTNDSMFGGIATSKQPAERYGLMRSLSYDKLGIVASEDQNGLTKKYYELNQAMNLVPVENQSAAENLQSAVQQPSKAYSIDAASVIIEEAGMRFRLPKNVDYACRNEFQWHIRRIF